MADRVHLSDITNLRRSMAATRTLPPGQIGRVLDECEVLLRQRDELIRVFSELQNGPWLEVRRLLAEVDRILGE